ncbi:XdhC family protein [Cochlodiniinecator piscidefendens]|uniref:XdhC family protein n=1 Tax=Cochlodiniinecator piscidefendens TaxID=2715756 RepID=UPI00140861D1|nr:XdhC family protein [Cochlodiniinecator piscidefendens]
MDFSHDDIPETALAWFREGRGAVLATVIETWGSAPRPVGSQLAISADGDIVGSVSGGCVEGAVIVEAQEAILDQKHRILTFGVSDENAFKVGLACGGTIRILLEPIGSVLPEGLLSALVEARKTRQPVAYVVDPDAEERKIVSSTEPPIDAHFGLALSDRFRSDKSGFEGRFFIGLHNPPLRLAVVGAVHIAQPLMQMARLAGYDAVLIDPRPVFGSAARFPNETIIDEWPDEALKLHGLDERTAVVTLTHDPKLDDPAIIAALRSKVFYLGCLGSKRTHAKRLERLSTLGFDNKDLNRIHGPVGLNIGAKSPAEIAISIMAQLTERLRGA